MRLWQGLWYQCKLTNRRYKGGPYRTYATNTRPCSVRRGVARVLYSTVVWYHTNRWKMGHIAYFGFKIGILGAIIELFSYPVVMLVWTRCRSSLSLNSCPIPSIHAFCCLSNVFLYRFRFAEIVSLAWLKMRSVSALIAGINSICQPIFLTVACYCALLPVITCFCLLIACFWLSI
jgi:hypothetical protein